MISKLIKYFSKEREEYVQYGMCPGYTIWTNTGSCIMGHMVIKTTDTREEVTHNLIAYINKMCKENNISAQRTADTIISNLKMNGLIT
jgi:hypothetical protein